MPTLLCCQRERRFRKFYLESFPQVPFCVALVSKLSELRIVQQHDCSACTRMSFFAFFISGLTVVLIVDYNQAINNSQ